MPRLKQMVPAQQTPYVRSMQLGDNRVHTMTFLYHLKESFLGLQPHRILSLFLDQF